MLRQEPPQSPSFTTTSPSAAAQSASSCSWRRRFPDAPSTPRYTIPQAHFRNSPVSTSRQRHSTRSDFSAVSIAWHFRFSRHHSQRYGSTRTCCSVARAAGPTEPEQEAEKSSTAMRRHDGSTRADRYLGQRPRHAGPPPTGSSLRSHTDVLRRGARATALRTTWPVPSPLGSARSQVS